MVSKGLHVLLWIIFVHSTGIYFFFRGFFLGRFSFPHTTSCNSEPFSCTLQPTHKRVVLLIIDALRFDFIAPDPHPYPVSPFYHGVLTLPRDLAAQRPGHSFLFNAHADPPTTTRQRIKGLTTGSLPTFADMRSNFGGTSIEEDSLMKQLRLAGKKIAFMGDDTWVSVFPDAFPSDISFPYDSFDIEDVHTVDDGVIAHLFPLLGQGPSSWDILIGHFLGVDHVGHHYRPDHPAMRSKLEQMNEVLSQVVDLLDNDTLLILLGDHGMNAAGDHGGHSVLETSTGMWIYSKSHPLADSSSQTFSPLALIPEVMLPNTVFPDAPSAHRTIQQIDLVPTLALLLGLPIPFNSLGTIIPELFAREALLGRALEMNAKQIHAYLSTYRASAAGGELDEMWAELENAWAETTVVDSTYRIEALHTYTRLALSVCRALWVQFNIISMVLGLVLLLVGTISIWVLFVRLRDVDVHPDWEKWLGERLAWGLRGAVGGAILGLSTYLSLSGQLLVQSLGALDYVLFGATFISAMSLTISTRPRFSFPAPFSKILAAFPLLLHTLAFWSSSFTIWEDHLVLFLLASAFVMLMLRTGVTAPNVRLRIRILGFNLLAVVCIRLSSWSTVCREEQGAACYPTFFVGILPLSLLPHVLAIPAALGLPSAVRRALRISRSYQGAGLFLSRVMVPAMLLGTAHWVLEHLEAAGFLGESLWWVRSVRTSAARCAMIIGLAGGGILWWRLPVGLKVTSSATNDTEGVKERRPVTVLDFGNAYGEPYLVFWCIAFGIIWTVTQLTGQLVLALAAVTVLAHLEATESGRYVHLLQTTSADELSLSAGEFQFESLHFTEVAPLALLGMHVFFGTGHQATPSSIQWKTAFVLTKSFVLPWSRITVYLNTFGPNMLLGLAAPLLGMWNVAPPTYSPSSAPTLSKEAMNAEAHTKHVARETLRAVLGTVLYHSVLLVGIFGVAGGRRQHPLLWKVWAPRVIVGVGAWGAVAVAALVGWGVGVRRALKKHGVIGVLAWLEVEA